MPVFGIRKPERSVVLRTGAYGIVTNISGKVMIIKNELGKFLPGGGLNPGEGYEEALRREFLEETGYEITIKRRLETMSWYIDTPAEWNLQVFNTGIFYEVELERRVHADIEEGHEVLFIDGESATDMHSDAQMWAIYKYILSEQYPPIIETNISAAQDRIYPLRLAARCIVQTESDKIILLKSEKLDICGLPGGGILRGEDIRTGAMREAKEETGRSIDQLKPLGASIEFSSMLQLTYYFTAVATAALQSVHLTELESDWGIYPIEVDIATAEEMIAQSKGIIMHEGFEVASMSRARNLAALSVYRQSKVSDAL